MPEAAASWLEEVFLPLLVFGDWSCPILFIRRSNMVMQPLNSGGKIDDATAPAP